MEFREIQELGIFQFFAEEEEINPDFLTEEELEILSHYRGTARRDFIRGRYCAKRALEKMGFLGAQLSLPKLPDGQVCWPEGVVGSISHAPGLAGAIVGWKKDFESLGLDIEKKDRVQEETWNRLFTENEQKYLLQFPLGGQSEKATEIFSLKEAFYKFQWPITKTFLGMRDVEWTGDSFFLPNMQFIPSYSSLSLRNNYHIIAIFLG